MRTFRTSMLAGAGAVALAAGVVAPGIAGASTGQGPSNITFAATDNGDCTATFTITNHVNIGGDWAKVNYWVGADAPERAPDFGDNRGSDGAVMADPAFENADGDEFEPYRDGGYHWGLESVETEETVDFSEYASEPQGPRAGEGEVNIAYRFTGVDTKDYDNSLEKLIVTGCDTGSGATGSLGSLDLFGSLGSL